MKRFSKLLVLALSLALVLGSMIGLSVTASAAEGDAPTVSIAGKNMSYTGAVQVMYYVEATNADLEADVRLLVSDAQIDLNNKANLSELDSSVSVKIYRGEATVNKGNGQVTYGIFFSDAIAPAELRKPIHAIPVVVDETGAIKATGTPSVYSPYQYAVNRFAADGVTAPQIALYKALLDYGAAVQAVLYDENEIKTTLGGWADAYYYLTVKNIIDGVVQNDAQIAEDAYRPSDVITAKSFLDTDEVFMGFSTANDYSNLYKEGQTSMHKAITCSTINDVTVKTLYAKYTTEYGVVENYDEFTEENVTLSGSTWATEAPAAGESGAKVVYKDGSITLVNNNMKHKGGTTGGNGAMMIETNGKYTNGDMIVIDTDITISSNYAMQSYTNNSGSLVTTDWILKIYPSSSAVSGISDSNEIFNLTVYCGDSTETFTLDGVTCTYGEAHDLRIIIIPKTDGKYDSYVYVDGKQSRASKNQAYLGNSTKGTLKSQLNVKGLVASFRGGGSLTAHTGTDPLASSVKFDDTFIGAIPGHMYAEYNYNDFSDVNTLNGVYETGSYELANLVKNGKLELQMANSARVYFKPVNALEDGDAFDRFVFEMDFTYNGGVLKEGKTDVKPGFIGFSWVDLGTDSTMYRYGEMLLTGTPDENGVYPQVKFMGQTYDKGVPVKIRYEYNPATAKVAIYHDGVLVTEDATISTMTGSVVSNVERMNTELYKGSKFYSFSIHFRGADYAGPDPEKTSFTIDNTYCGYKTLDDTIDLTFRYNNGETADETVTIKYGDKLELPETPTKTLEGSDKASVFLGWKIGEKFVGANKASAQLTNVYATNNMDWYYHDNMIIEAVWKDPVKVTLTSEGVGKDIFFFADEEYDLGTPPTHSTGESTEFLGWYNGTTPVAQTGASWSLGTNVTLDAWWDIAYTVTFNPGEGATFKDGVTTSMSIKLGDEYGADVDGKALPTETDMNAPAGKVLLGWYVGLKRISDSGNWKYEEDIELTAKWGQAIDVFDDYTSQAAHKSFYRSDENFAQTYTAGTKYVINFTFTYMGGSPKADGTNPTSAGNGAAFFTITNSKAGGTRIVYDYPYYTGELITVGDKKYYENCVFSKLEFEYGVTYHLRLEYVVGDKSQTKIHVLDDKGNIVKSGFYSYTNNNSVSSGGVDDTKFGGFYIERRPSYVGVNEFNYVMEDISIAVEDAPAT